MRVSHAEISEASRLVGQYRSRGLLIDTQLAVLLVVGLVSRRWVETHKRLDAYSSSDFDALHRFCSMFSRMVTLPHVLAEVGNLVGRDAWPMLKILCIDQWEEQGVASRTAAAQTEYPYLGLTDAAILGVADHSFLVLTDDGLLAAAVRARTGAALSFDLVRAFWNR